MQPEFQLEHMASLPIPAVSTQKHPVHINYVIQVEVQLPIGEDTVVHFPSLDTQLMFGFI